MNDHSLQPKSIRLRYRWSLLSIAVLVVSFSLLIGYGYRISEKPSLLSYPLLSVIHEIRTEANRVQDHLEGIAQNQISTKSAVPWQGLEQAVWHLDMMLGRPIDAQDSAAVGQIDERLQQLESLKFDLAAYRSAVGDYLGLRPVQVTGKLPSDVLNGFGELAREVDAIEATMNQRLNHEHRRFRLTFFGLTAFSLILVGIAGYLSWRFERQQIRIRSILTKANDELEGKVKARTQLLSRANDQLLREIEAHKKVEQKLLDHQTQLRRISSELLQTQEKERRQIATEIHDRIGQALAVTKIQLGALQAMLDNPSHLAPVEEIRALITQTIQDTRTLTFELSPPVLYELGLQAALEWLAEKLQNQSGLSVRISSNRYEEQLDIDRRVFLFQSVRELLFNVIKHANATMVDVQMVKMKDNVEIHVSDDGCGIDVANMDNPNKTHERGFGLFSIREQLRHYGGQLAFESEAGKGTQITIEMPLKAEHEKRNVR